MRALILSLRALAPPLLALALVLPPGCAAPPPAAYVVAARPDGVPAGPNARGEPCTAQPGRIPPTDLPVRQAEEITCGDWTQPAARILELDAPAGGGQLDRLAAGGIWRSWLEERLACQAPQPVRLAGGVDARLLPCTRRNGGWPHLALVAAGPRGVVLADGLSSSLPVVERRIAGLPVEAAAGPRSAAMALAVARLSAEAFGAGDVKRYEDFMALGHELNQAGDYPAAEAAYRPALALQERVLSRGDPNVAGALTHLALNISIQQRYGLAEGLFQRADRLAPRAADATAGPRLLHYRGLHAMNYGDLARAAALLEAAEQGYARLAPERVVAQATEAADLTDGLAVDPTAHSALLGLAEARRNRAVVLARQGQGPAAAELAASARDLLHKAGLEPSLFLGRTLRSQGGVAGTRRQAMEAARFFGDSARRFGLAVPGERPEAVTLFLAGARLDATGEPAAALEAFRTGARILRARQIGLPISLVQPYLDALERAAARDRAAAPALAAEMFVAAQLAQRTQTTRLVAQAAARMAAAAQQEDADTPLRTLQNADQTLRELFRRRDAAEGATAAETRALDARIAAVQAERAAAEEAAAAAAPGYRQLLQTAAEVPAVAAVLAPDEALVTMLQGAEHGHVFAVTAAGGVTARRIELSEAAVLALAKRIRATLGQPGAQPGPFDMAAAAALYRAVLGPVAPALGGAKRLVVVADGVLLSVPFGLLLDGTGDPAQPAAAPWLARRFAVAHITSPQTLVSLRAGANAGASGAPLPYAGLGDPVPPTRAQVLRSFPADRCATDAETVLGLHRLPETRVEVQAAQRLAGGGADSVRLGPAFTAAALPAMGLDRYRILHFATHGLLPGGVSCIAEPALMLSTPPGAPDAAGSFLRASAVLDLTVKAELVILSACNTGSGAGREDSGGEALSGLARAFFYAGARGLLVTHWAVDDTATRMLIADTLRHQAAGSGTAEALQAAQLAMIDSGRFSHPDYWAGFALIGDGRRASGQGAQAQAGPGLRQVGRDLGRETGHAAGAL